MVEGCFVFETKTGYGSNVGFKYYNLPGITDAGQTGNRLSNDFQLICQLMFGYKGDTRVLGARALDFG